MTHQLKMFNQSRLTLIGSEMVVGVDCYKVRAEMDMGTMANQLAGDVPSLVPMPGMNYSELFRNMRPDVYYSREAVSLVPDGNETMTKKNTTQAAVAA
jgi:hypothetical protein